MCMKRFATGKSHLGVNDTSTLVGHFVSSKPYTVREKKDRRDSRGDEREGQGRKRKNRNES